jgi:hypothetical protein
MSRKRYAVKGLGDGWTKSDGTAPHFWGTFGGVPPENTDLF